MTRCFLGLILLLCAGCVQWGDNPPPGSAPQPLTPLAKELNSGQVTVQNAHAIAQTLWDQMDAETQEITNPTKKTN